MTRTHAALAAALCTMLGLGAALPARAQEAGARVIVQFKADSGLLRKQVQAAGERHASQAQALGQRVGLALTAGAGLSERSQVVFARGLGDDFEIGGTGKHCLSGQQTVFVKEPVDV